ncbi:putative uncharacterized protein DDB_G0290521 [Pygocentrus nattereri]|uniref:putative uncharacterized protein DDB_G0290521 n=1 Tax=Pygocentrus nattereri TaxID=42514 RepID=UPI0018918FA7|nr:putative uncharacterized protein DDB_G0290521 [Pygocentrus nattereri]
MPGSTQKTCQSCKAQINVGCKHCKLCGASQPQKVKLQQAKDKASKEWAQKMLNGRNTSKLINSTNLLLHKFHMLGYYPLLLLGRRKTRQATNFRADVFYPQQFSSEMERTSISTIRLLYEGLLKVALNPEANPNSSNAPETNTSSAHTPETNTSFSHAPETNFSCSDGPTENPSSSVAPLHTEPTYTLILTPVTSEKENSTVVLNLEVNPSSSDDPETSPICSDAPETSPFSSDGPEASPSFSAPREPRSSSLDELNPILSPVTSGNGNSTDKYPCKKRTQEVTPNVSSSTFNRTFPCKKRRIKINPSECPVHTMADTYPVQKILSQRVSKEGTKEVKVRWQQCSGCGIKWKDTWEPFNEIFP